MTVGLTPSNPPAMPSSRSAQPRPAPVGRKGAARSLASDADGVDVSVLVPANDEAENLPLFMELAAEAFRGSSASYEVIVIDDGSTDDTWSVLERLCAEYPFLRVVRHRVRRGIADALRTGYLSARGSVLVFYPADLQFRPEDIPTLVEPVISGEYDMATGLKLGRYDRAFVSRVYNWLSRALFDVPVRDLNSVKAYRREIMEVQPVRPDWHRYMIVIAAAEGFSVTEIPIPLHPRHAGRSKFGIGRIPIGVLDMLSVWFELQFGRKPLLLFGLMGAALFAIGIITGLVAIGIRVFAGVGFRPLLNLIETSVVVGSVFLVGGLLGEMIAGQRAELREVRRQLDEMQVPIER
ncbi:MAG: glycosyltransferase family 2 protein [Gemmatimonadaceae bacterium]